MHYYQFNLGDYARDTQHLDDMEDLAYRRMLDLYYLKEKPLPRNKEQIARLIRMRSHIESIANVLQEFFVCEPDGYHNAGADKVLEKIYSKSFKAKKAAEKRWSKNNNLEDANAKQKQSKSNADGMLPNTQDPLPNTQLSNRAKRFAPPTLSEATEYFGERAKAKGIFISYEEPEKFIDFYESKNWYVGKNKMKDWKAAIRNWLSNVKPDKQDIIQQSSNSNWHEEDLGL